MRVKSQKKKIVSEAKAARDPSSFVWFGLMVVVGLACTSG
jgi:hypothetical protein